MVRITNRATGAMIPYQKTGSGSQSSKSPNPEYPKVAPIPWNTDPLQGWCLDFCTRDFIRAIGRYSSAGTMRTCGPERDRLPNHFPGQLTRLQVSVISNLSSLEIQQRLPRLGHHLIPSETRAKWRNVGA